jgi:hypothetical protein
MLTIRGTAVFETQRRRQADRFYFYGDALIPVLAGMPVFGSVVVS